MYLSSSLTPLSSTLFMMRSSRMCGLVAVPYDVSLSVEGRGKCSDVLS